MHIAPRIAISIIGKAIAAAGGGLVEYLYDTFNDVNATKLYDHTPETGTWSNHDTGTYITGAVITSHPEGTAATGRCQFILPEGATDIEMSAVDLWSPSGSYPSCVLGISNNFVPVNEWTGSAPDTVNYIVILCGYFSTLLRENIVGTGLFTRASGGGFNFRNATGRWPNARVEFKQIGTVIKVRGAYDSTSLWDVDLSYDHGGLTASWTIQGIYNGVYLSNSAIRCVENTDSNWGDIL